MKRTIICALAACCAIASWAIDLAKATIVYDGKDDAFVAHMAQVLADDIERVSGVRPQVSTQPGSGPNVILMTVSQSKYATAHTDLRGEWERYAIDTDKHTLRITGSDARGLAYGVFHVSEAIGVSPWYWWADVPVKRQGAKGQEVEYAENMVSSTPSVKYRGLFINDEDWGMKTWAAGNFEKELRDIGPKTYDKVCELILRLKGNMLAPAMHTCTGAFYSHFDSQRMANKWRVMITTSHCEPLLFNNAAPSEWSKQRDGEWNYLTNKKAIYRKLNDRIKATAAYDNIYTMGMRGLHDEAMKGSKNPTVRARTLESVFADQRTILRKHKKKSIDEIPQIFVPYKETLDIYDAGLKVPDDITLVWPDDNYGYMKRVSDEGERQRKGGSGVYYHLSYLGIPHDYLWMSTTAPALMYAELRKAYDAGADRYWLLNVGDIKPMEVETQHFFDMAWNFDNFSYDNANKYQAQWLASVFGQEHLSHFQFILDNFYRLAWERKPEFMGNEIEWDSKENSRLHDTDFSFETGQAQRRLSDYRLISDLCDNIEKSLDKELRPAFFEMLGYSVKSAYQMNRKFLMAQRNHETGDEAYAKLAHEANDSVATLLRHYNTMLNGKWNGMMSEVPPGLVARYQNMPEVGHSKTDAYKLPLAQIRPTFNHKISLDNGNVLPPFRRIEGMGTDWKVIQLGNPLDVVEDPGSLNSSHTELTFELPQGVEADSITLCVSAVPMWPVSKQRSNRFGVSLDDCRPVVCENKFKEGSMAWKLQVLENRKDFIFTLPIDKQKKVHKLSLIIGDPGQMIQSICYNVK